jgi:hypothetical protein
MARAGFYAIHNSHIRFGSDGRWYADGQPIVNQRIADLFSNHVRRSESGGYMLEIGKERAPIEVDDTPYVVVAVDVDEEEGIARLELNDHSGEDLDPASLRIGAGEVLYCRVKGGTEPARFLRSAYYHLAPFITESQAGRFDLWLGGVAHPLARV